MKLLEYEAKAFLAYHGIAVPEHYLAGETPEFLPAVIKSQVPVGGRGKAGGVVIVETEDEYKTSLSKIKKLKIQGFKPKTVFAEEVLDIDKEFYLSILVDKVTAEIVLMAHKQGGIEVEDNDHEGFLRVVLDGTNAGLAAVLLAECYGTTNDIVFALQYIVENLYECFVTNDTVLLEINPLVLTKDNVLIAGDCKMELDDSAVIRHPDWDFEQKQAEANFVTLDKKGTVATIANGAGLAMATVDAVADAGLVPANFLDIGGGANEASVLAAFERIMEYPNIKVIIINIFAGITRCDEVAKAIIAAKKKLPGLPPLSIRLAGTNFEAAAKLLSGKKIPTLATLEDCIATAKEIIG